MSSEAVQIHVTDEGTKDNLGIIKSGINNYITTPAKSNTWIWTVIRAGGGTTNVSFTNYRLLFEDGASLNIQEAINQNYIEPLVLYATLAGNIEYLWPLTESFIINGDSGGGTNYPLLRILFKTKNKSTFIGFQLETNRGFNVSYDGYSISELSNFDLSIIPFF